MMKAKREMIETNVGRSFESQVKKIERLLDDGYIIDIPEQYRIKKGKKAASSDR